jgi:hypothetical protein
VPPAVVLSLALAAAIRGAFAARTLQECIGALLDVFTASPSTSAGLFVRGRVGHVGHERRLSITREGIGPLLLVTIAVSNKELPQSIKRMAMHHATG